MVVQEIVSVVDICDQGNLSWVDRSGERGVSHGMDVQIRIVGFEYNSPAHGY
jgi:hypothetical protein